MDYFLELAIGTAITIITYFLKKTMDKMSRKIFKILKLTTRLKPNSKNRSKNSETI